MYKRPSKRTQRLQLFALYSVMSITVIVVVALLVLVVANYGFNRETGTLEQRGLVQFASTPSGANVTIDGSLLSSRTSTKQSVEPGEHSFILHRSGYEPWKLKTNIPEGSLVWLNYARLVPQKRSNQSISTYASMVASLPAPDKKSILLQYDQSRPVFRLVDITHDQPSEKDITLASTLYAEPTEGQVPIFSLDSWDKGGRYVLVRVTLGDATDVIVVDTRNPERSVNISREFSLPITQAIFSGHSGNILYIVSENNLRKVDISGGTVSRALVSGIESFSLFDTHTIAFTAQAPGDSEGAASSRVAGIYRDGDDKPTILKTTQQDTPLFIATSTYYGSIYTAIAEGTKLTLYKGQYDRGVKNLERIAEKTIAAPITRVEFNETGSYVLIRSGTSYTSYGLERKLFRTVDLPVAASGLYWLDPMHLGLIVDGTLTMRDIDGTNKHDLTAVSGIHQGVLSRNGTYLYSIGAASDDTGVQLQRFRMILK